MEVCMIFRSYVICLVGQVFADEESSEVPVRVPKALVEGLPDTTLYCGSSMSTICRGERRHNI